MSFQPLTDVELAEVDRNTSPNWLCDRYRELLAVYHDVNDEVLTLRERCFAMESVRDDARAHSQRLLEKNRESEAFIAKIVTERDRARTEIVLLRAELAARAAEPERRTRNQRTLLVSVAGTIAGGIHRGCGTIDAPEVLAHIAEEAVALARAIMDEVDHLEPRTKS